MTTTNTNENLPQQKPRLSFWQIWNVSFGLAFRAVGRFATAADHTSRLAASVDMMSGWPRRSVRQRSRERH